MARTKSWLAALLTGAVALGTGCATMGARDTRPPDSAPDMGGSGLDPNPDHNIPNAPNGIDGNPLNTPPSPPAAPVNSPTPGGVAEPGTSTPMP
jgi:hypothetical protein